MSDANARRRWRLVLGRYAEEALGQGGLSGADSELDGALDYLYGRDHQARGLLRGRAGPGTLDPSSITALDWLQRSRKLFPEQVFERLQDHALSRFGLDELLADPATVQALEPNQALVRNLLRMRGRISAELLDTVRALVTRVVDDITQRLRRDVVNAVSGRRNRLRRSTLASSQNFDWRATIRANLRHYDRATQRLLIERPVFNGRVKRHLPWDVILCVDQSGSMADSVMYSAIVASILSSLPALNVRLVVFDTSVVDLTAIAGDPVQVLMTVQLGGGTDIGKALAYCETLVTRPQRTVLALISDFAEGALPGPMLASVRRMAEARVRLLGLAALDEHAHPVYDDLMARRLAACGMEVAVLTPQKLAEWLGEVIE